LFNTPVTCPLELSEFEIINDTSVILDEPRVDNRSVRNAILGALPLVSIELLPNFAVMLISGTVLSKPFITLTSAIHGTIEKYSH
jgi:hypothetical protein